VLGAHESRRMARFHLAPSIVSAELNAANAIIGSRAIRRYFDRPETQLDAEKQSAEVEGGEELADLNLYYEVRVQDEVDQRTMLEQLSPLDSVETAYAPPIPTNASADVAPVTGNLSASQGYVEAAPQGIDARYARTVEGGAGLGVKIIDVEGGWNLTHEDLPPIFAGSGYSTTQ